MGILSAVAFPRFADTDSFKEVLLKDAALSSFRLSQKVALSHQDKTIYWRVQRSATSEWQFCTYDSNAEATSNPCTHGSKLEIAEVEATASISYKLNGAAASTLAVGSGLSIKFNTLGFVAGAGALGTAPTPVTETLVFNLPDTTLCLSLAGYLHESSC